MTTRRWSPPVFARSAARGALLSVLVTAPALAGDPVGAEWGEARVDQGVSVVVSADNRNDRPHSVESRTDHGTVMVLDRLDVSLSRGALRAGVRLDSAWYPRSPDATAVALELLEDRPEGASSRLEGERAYFRRMLSQTGAELSNRYIEWTYPAKAFVRRETASGELTLGDYHAELGRGLVLSLRRVDAQLEDTTARGVRIARRLRLGPGQELVLVALAGALNPLRIDGSSGRYLGVTDAVTPGWLAAAEAGMPRALATDFLPRAATLAPDRVAGAQIAAQLPRVRVATQGVYFVRQAPLATGSGRADDGVLNLSESVELPRIGEHADGYLEAAVQQRTVEAPRQTLGHALYAAFGARSGPLALSFEGKHYRRFEPVRANIDVGRAGEFSGIAYSAPPSTLASFADYELGEFNTCTTGGRLRVELGLGAAQRVLAWLGRYASWSESVANPDCDLGRSRRNDAWDPALGWQAAWDGHRSYAELTLGGRLDHAARPIPDGSGGATRVFYREVYARYHATQRLSGAFSLELQGTHRWREQTYGGPGVPWREGEQVTGISWERGLSCAVGVEYDTSPRVAPTYLNLTLSWRISDRASLGLFVGQRRGALRCVGGVCRQYPPFEGLRLDAQLRW